MATGKVVNKTTVYYGPGTSYPSENSFAGPNDSVTIFWLENGYYYIEYPAGAKKKRMYIIKSAVSSISGTVPSKSPTMLTQYVNTAGKTYAGPGNTDYPEAGALARGEAVSFFGEKSNGYALIEYSVSTGKKRAWFPETSLSEKTPVASTAFYNYVNNGWTISSPWRNKGSSGYAGHLGVDYVKSAGTKIRAIAAGTVAGMSSTKLASNGYTIVLKHEVSGKTFYSFYAHMDSKPPFSVGDKVTAGQEIHPYGSSGNVTGAHVHIGVYTGSLNTDQYGYYKVNGVISDFEDNGTGRISYKGYTFYNAEQVIESNGSIIV